MYSTLFLLVQFMLQSLNHLHEVKKGWKPVSLALSPLNRQHNFMLQLPWKNFLPMAAHIHLVHIFRLFPVEGPWFDELVQTAWCDVEHGPKSLLVELNYGDHLHILTNQAILDDAVNFIDSNAKEEVHNYDWEDEDEGVEEN